MCSYWIKKIKCAIHSNPKYPSILVLSVFIVAQQISDQLNLVFLICRNTWWKTFTATTRLQSLIRNTRSGWRCSSSSRERCLPEFWRCFMATSSTWQHGPPSFVPDHRRKKAPWVLGYCTDENPASTCTEHHQLKQSRDSAGLHVLPSG